MCDFLEDNYLKEQVRSIKEIAEFITNLKRVGGGLGEYMFDKVKCTFLITVFFY